MDNISVDISVNEKAWDSTLSNLPSKIVQDCILATLTSSEVRINGTNKLEVSVLLTGDEEIQELNNTYRKKNKPTNVLSFPQNMEFSDTENEEGCLLLGDIVLSIHTIQLEASNQNKSMKDHLAHLIVHGTLHLLGYDHQTDQDATQMESIEIAVLNSMGVSNPYKNQTKNMVYHV